MNADLTDNLISKKSALDSISSILTSGIIIGLIVLVGCAQANKTDVGLTRTKAQ